MPLDPTLVRGLTPISMPQRDPNAAINQLGAIMKIQGLQNEMQANQLQAQKYQREANDAAALAAARAAYDPNNPATERALFGAGGGADLQSMAAAEKSRADAVKLQREQSLNSFRTVILPGLTPDNPNGIVQAYGALAAHPLFKNLFDGMPPDAMMKSVEIAMSKPGGAEKVLSALYGLTPDKLAEMDVSRRNVDLRAKELGVSQQQAETAQRNATVNENRERREAFDMLSQQSSMFGERNNPGFEIKETPQGLVSVNKRTGEAQAIMLGGAAVESTQSPAFKAKVRTAEKRGELAAQAESDQAARARGAANVLTSLGYNLGNPSADDKVTSLIKKSTGGLLEAGASQIPRVIGQTTPGRLAIAELKTIANNTAMDLLGGKIGAGISNADRDFIIAGLGEIGDPGIPVEERVAAWRQVTARLARIANADKFSPATDGTAPAGGQSAPAQQVRDEADAIISGGK